MNTKIKVLVDIVSTPSGLGTLVGQDGNGNYYVAISRKNLIPADRVCTGPCLHLWFKHQEVSRYVPHP